MQQPFFDAGQKKIKRDLRQDEERSRREQFQEEPLLNMEKTALIIVDVQKAFADPSWGKRNNPEAKANIARALKAWREKAAA